MVISRTICYPSTIKRTSRLRGYSGRIEGEFLKGDEITVLPSGFSSRIKSIDTFDGPIRVFPKSVFMTLEDDIDISRGDMLVRENNQPTAEQDINLMMLMNERKMVPRGKYTIIQYQP